MNPGEGLPLCRHAFEVARLTRSPAGAAFQRYLDGPAPLETVTILKPSAVGPSIPPGLMGGQVQA